MANIIDLMKELGYPSNDAGVCFGLAWMAEKARRRDQYSIFKQRMDYLDGLEKNCLNTIQNDVYKIAKSKKKLTTEDKMVLTIQPFFFQLWAHFRPSDIQAFLGVPGPNLTQLDISVIEKLMHENLSTYSSIPFFFGTEPTRQGKYDKGLYLYHFLKEIKNSSVKTGLIVSSSTHAVHLFYDQQQKKWHLTDHSELSYYSSTKTLLKPLIEAFAKKNLIYLAVNLFVERVSSYPEQRLISKLKTINRQSLETLFQKNDPNRLDVNNVTALFLAADEEDLSTVDFLLNLKNININKLSLCGQTALSVTAYRGRLNALKVLLKKKDIDVNRADEDGCTPLALAAENGYLKVVNYLLKQKNIKVSQADNEGRTPLFIAIRKRHLEVVKVLLLQSKIRVNKANNKGFTPLLKAAQYGDLDAVRALLSHPGIEVNKEDHSGRTPLWVAAEAGHLEVVNVLLERLTLKEVNHASENGLNPLQIAKVRRHKEIVHVLSKYQLTTLQILKNLALKSTGVLAYGLGLYGLFKPEQLASVDEVLSVNGSFLK